MLITRAYYNFLRDKCIKTEVIENQDGEQETRDIYANVSNHSFISDIENEANNKNYNDYSYDCSTSLIESIELERISALFNDNIKKLTPREQEVIIRAYRDNDYSNNHTQDIIKKLKRIMGVKA
jgi:DNA-directed RNA polymerase sigma subunit (sigma70/sigma32)